MTRTTGPALALDDLRVSFPSAQGPVSAVDGVSLELRPDEILGLVGESGCGKSTLANAAMGLLPESAEVSGAVRLGDRDLTILAERDLRRIRGDEIAMVFQDPSTSLDPVWTVGDQVAETIRAHRDVSRREAKARALKLMREVGIPSAEQRYGEPPHRMSGGMKQRIVIAAALANDPAVLIADEPTTALDVTIQAQILQLLDGLRQRRGTAVLLITHDLGVVAQVCNRVAVMYAGQLVEVATTEQIFSHPAHPYTEALLRAVPGTGEPGAELTVIPGQVPDLAAPPVGCRFAPRCPFATEECSIRPPLEGDEAHGAVACWHPRSRDREVTAR
ncbi:MAG TPA: ABC transporter ATP-binding protein [Nocardioides sp.]|jgi:oligopeptide/dipeptide ABC transporter ATP-binding protein|nr:ABC transporter ATP-binding protein [Nocardioides sp.]